MILNKCTILNIRFNNNVSRKESSGQVFSPNYPFPYQVWSDRLTILNDCTGCTFKRFHPIFSIKKESMECLNILLTNLLFPAADSMSLLHLRNARLAELGEGCPCFWQVWHSLRKDGQVSTTWTMIFCQNIHTDLDYWLRLAVLMKIQWYSTRFFSYPPNWTKLDLTFILNNYQSFRSNCSLISGVS